MEVVLRKTKITKSIVQQTIDKSVDFYFEDWTNNNLIGWLIYHTLKVNYRYQIFYDKDTQTLTKLKHRKVSGIDTYEKGIQEPDGKGGYHFPMKFFIRVRSPYVFTL